MPSTPKRANKKHFHVYLRKEKTSKSSSSSSSQKERERKRERQNSLRTSARELISRKRATSEMPLHARLNANGNSSSCEKERRVVLTSVLNYVLLCFLFFYIERQQRLVWRWLIFFCKTSVRANVSTVSSNRTARIAVNNGQSLHSMSFNSKLRFEGFIEMGWALLEYYRTRSRWMISFPLIVFNYWFIASL